MTQAKICGINSLEALEGALAAQADYVGLVFFPKSPRDVSIDQAAQLARHARDDGRTQIVALTVQADLELLAAIAGRVQPDIIQLHGDESAADMARVRANVPGVTVWRACPVATATDVQAAEAYWQPGRLVDRLLFDARADTTSTLPGGNGLTFDWTILSGVNPRGNFALAGGLTPDNVALAVSKTGADIVDVSSGVETAPGMKSAKLMADFVNAAKSVQPLQSSEVGA